MFLLERLRNFICSKGMPQISTICSREEFSCIIERELARAERSGQVFSVVEFDIGDVEANRESGKHLLQVLAQRLRSTDEVGWLPEHRIGVLLYNTSREGAQIFVKRILESLSLDFTHPSYKIHTYPTEEKSTGEFKPSYTQNGKIVSYACEELRAKKTKPLREMRMLYPLAMPKWKRLMDITGALLLLIVLSPLFIVIALIIKIVSPGPVFFKQLRVGYGGKLFTIYKFRTMKVNADFSAHQKYLSKLIRETNGKINAEKPMVKLDDPQIIPVGKILRTTCIDELPQLLNVLRGEMSLVGPRPPIPYEVEDYITWHTGRFDAVPGMTGLWQVSGKNRLTFKEMARLDIRYARQISFGLDIKILLLTPLAIFFQIRDSLRKGKHSSIEGSAHA
ncbi:MAG: sugar transferase [Desulfobacterota bacterium]|nr:sugar transferase [Thermodesulfobacteriota bacterium]